MMDACCLWFRISALNIQNIVVIPDTATGMNGLYAVFTTSHFESSSSDSFFASSIKSSTFGVAFTANTVVAITPILPKHVNPIAT